MTEKTEKIKKIEGNLVLNKDTVIDRDLYVDGSIIGKKGNRYTLNVKGDIFAKDILVGAITAHNITAADISAENISAWIISAKNMSVQDISADDITAENISAWDISALDIKAWDISANNIAGFNISARNISAINIKANDITYYAVCYAYNNITCRSIKGLRPNSRHFVLDGKITLRWEVKCKNCDSHFAYKIILNDR